MVRRGGFSWCCKRTKARQCSIKVSERFRATAAAIVMGFFEIAKGLNPEGFWALKILHPQSLNPSCSDCLEKKTVTTRKTSEILGLWFVWSIITPARNLRNHHLLCLHVFTSRENYSSTLGVFFSQHTSSEEILWNEFAVFALLSCHGTADCDMNYLNWTNWLLHSSSRSLCGQSLDVHCRLERINGKTYWTGAIDL